jgi:hypothetical protein
LVEAALRRVEPGLGLLGRFPRGLQRERARVLDLVCDVGRGLGGVLELLGELRHVLHGRRLLVDGVTARAEFGRISRVDEEDMVGRYHVVLPVDPLAGLLHLDRGARHHLRVAVDARLGGDERARALVELGLGDRLEQVHLARRDGNEGLDLAEEVLHQLRAGDGPALRAVLVALLALLRLGRLGLGGVPARGGDLRHLVVGVHLLHEPPDVLHPLERGDRALGDLGLLEDQLLVLDVEPEARDRRALGDEVVVGDVVLEDVVVDDLAVIDLGGQAVALRHLRGEVAVLHVLVRLGLGALGERLALVEARDHHAGRAVGGDHHLERGDLGLADRLELALVAHLDDDGHAGLELVALGELVADVREVELEARRLVHVVGDADADDRGLELRIGLCAVHHQLEIGDHLVVGHRELASYAPPWLDRPGGVCIEPCPAGGIRGRAQGSAAKLRPGRTEKVLRLF